MDFVYGFGKEDGSPRQKCLSWQTSLLCIVEDLKGGESVAVGITVAVAVAVAVAVGITVAVAVGFIGFGATIRKHQENSGLPHAEYFLSLNLRLGLESWPSH